jgi:thiamine phosphate synthase YjbQ (UPF0047 family)
MEIKTDYIELISNGNGDVIDITPGLNECLFKTGLLNGVLTVFIPGATGALTTIEYEPGLVKDLN